MNKNTWIFDIRRFINADIKIKLYIKELIEEDVLLSINNNGYKDQITKELINDSKHLFDILGF